MKHHVRRLSSAPIVRAVFATPFESLEPRRLLSAGQLDTSFGNKGNAVYGDAPELLQASTRDGAGRMIIAGVVNPQGDRGDEIVLRRFNTDGTVDATFGSGGSVATDFFPAALERAEDVAVQADGKIVLLGDSINPSNGHPSQTLLARFDSDGSLDHTFATGGALETSSITFNRLIGFTNQTAQLLIQPDGKILACGTTDDGDNPDLELARFNTNGSFDSTFGNGGIETRDTGGFEYAVGYRLQDNGKIFVLASRSNNGVSSFFARFNSDGSFSGTAAALPLDGATEEHASDFILMNDGSFLVASNRAGGSVKGLVVTRYNPDGSIDTSFGTAGHVALASGSSGSPSMHLRSDGDILVESLADINGNAMRIEAFTPSGASDPSFSGGHTDVDLPVGPNFAPQFFVQGNDKLLLPFAPQDGGEMTIARLKVTGQLDPIFGTNGTTHLSHPLNGALTRVSVNSDGTIFALDAPLESGPRLYRFKSNGSIDTSFGGGDGFINLAFDGTPIQRSDGKLVVGSINGIALLNTDGTMDNTFAGGAGVIGGTFFGFTLDSSDRIIASDGDVIHRYNSNGTVDQSWTVSDTGSLGFELALRNFAIQSDGKILVSGTAQGGQLDNEITGSNAVIIRLNTNGKIDTTFGDNGIAQEDLQTFENGSKMVIRPNGKIVLLVDAEDSVTGLAQFNPDGTHDLTFGPDDDAHDGDQRYGFAPDFTESEGANDMLLQPDGKILLLGSYSKSGSPETSGWAVNRINLDGSLDSSFGGTGTAHFTFGAAGNEFDIPAASAMAMTPDGKLVVVGSVNPELPQMALSKIELANPTPPLASISKTGTLIVNGTSGNDTFTVVLGVGGLEVQRSGSGPTASLTFNLSKVKRIYLDAGAGDDNIHITTTRSSTVLGGDGRDTILCGEGDDSIDGGANPDHIEAGAGNDIVNGGGGNDQISGGGGNDTLIGGAGADNLFGNGGADTADYSSYTVSVFLSLDDKANDGASGEGDNIHADIENLIGGGAGDRIVGNPFNNVLKGNGGNDTIYGGDGNDTIAGGSGHNLLDGQGGDDVIS